MNFESEKFEILTGLYKQLVQSQDYLESSLFGNVDTESLSCAIILLEDLLSLTEECELLFLCEPSEESVTAFENRADTILEEILRILPADHWQEKSFYTLPTLNFVF